MNLSAAYLKKQQEWLEEGTERGIEQVAIAALREGCPTDLIIKLTGLTIAEIEQLRANAIHT
jgi:hypothetical protein